VLETSKRFGRALFARDNPFWVMVGVRLWFLALAAMALVWAPMPAGQIPSERAYNGLTDLLFGTFEKWDSGNFLYIARHGYSNAHVPAFYPLYPLFVAGGHYVFRSYLVAGVLISLVAAGFGAWAVASIARTVVGERGARDSVIYLALFPTAFVFTSVYSEGLFLALSAGSFLAAVRRRPWLAAIAAALAVGTRPVGVALVPALVYLLWPRRRSQWWHPLPSLVAVPAALGAYAAYLQHRRGDWLAAAHASATYWDRSFPRFGPLTGLKDALAEGINSTDLVLRHLPRGMAAPAGFDLNDQQAMQNTFWMLCLLIAFALTVVAWRHLGAAFGIYSTATLLVILSEPVKGVALQSFPRYMMDDFPIFIALAFLTTNRPTARTCTLVTFASLGAVAAVAFSRSTGWIA
jgi:hypothetical protein